MHIALIGTTLDWQTRIQSMYGPRQPNVDSSPDWVAFQKHALRRQRQIQLACPTRSTHIVQTMVTRHRRHNILASRSFAKDGSTKCCDRPLEASAGYYSIRTCVSKWFEAETREVAE